MFLSAGCGRIGPVSQPGPPVQSATLNGFATLEMTTVNQHDEVVLHFWRSPMIACKDPQADTGHNDDFSWIKNSFSQEELLDVLPRGWNLEPMASDLTGLRAPVLAAALDETKRGRGVALVRGLPRENLDEKGFELLTWAIGLHAGVPRPQGKSTHYISAVRDAGMTYRKIGRAHV